MTFADTSHIKLDVLLDSVYKAEQLIKKFVEIHNRDKSSFTSQITSRMSKGDVKSQLIGLTILYQQKIIPEIENKIRKDARLEIEAEWRKKGKEPYYQKEIGTTGKKVKETAPGFDNQFRKRVDKKKKSDKVYWRRTAEQTRIGSASNIINGGPIESDIPSGFEMGGGGDNGYTPPPRPDSGGNNQANECSVCKGAKKDQKEWFKSSNQKEYCGKCYRQYFIANFLKKLAGWNQLGSKTQVHYLSQINKCKKAVDFRTLKQMVLKTIQESSATCSQCNKEFSGKRWTVENVEDKLFCSEVCCKNWIKLNQGGQGQVNSQENENGGEIPTTDSGESGDNSESDSDSSSDNEREENNDMLENIQEIANLPLPQAQQKAEQEIEKLLKDNSISEAELDKEDWSGESNWKSHLRNLDTSQKVAEFTQKMYQEILRKALNKQNLTSNQNNQKKPENDWTVPIIIFSLSLLALITLIIIIRKRRQKGF